MQKEHYKNQFAPWKQGYYVALPEAVEFKDIAPREATTLALLDLRIALAALNGNKYGRIACALKGLKPSE